MKSVVSSTLLAVLLIISSRRAACMRARFSISPVVSTTCAAWERMVAVVSARLPVISLIFGWTSSRMACAAFRTGVACSSRRAAMLSIRDELLPTALYSANRSPAWKTMAMVVKATNISINVSWFTWSPAMLLGVRVLLAFTAGLGAVRPPHLLSGSAQRLFLPVHYFLAALHPLAHRVTRFFAAGLDVIFAFRGGAADRLARLAAGAGSVKYAQQRAKTKSCQKPH